MYDNLCRVLQHTQSTTDLSFFLRIVFFLAVALTSSALIIERMEGLLDRSWVAGMWVHCLAQG